MGVLKYVAIFGIIFVNVVNNNALTYDGLSIEPFTIDYSTVETTTTEPSTAEIETTEIPTFSTEETETTLEPPVLCSDGDLFLSADKCDEFYMCSFGIGILKYCPSGLYWDPLLNVCSWDSQYCENDLPGTESSESGCLPESAVLPLESDCSKYIQCMNNIKVIMSCPPGLLWNQPLERCDYECQF